MAYPAVTYTFTNGTTASATEVNQNFTDLINGLSDGTKDISISALTVAGTASLNGAVNIGNATSDDIAVNGYITTALIPKADDSYDLGTAALAWQDGYFDGKVYTDSIKALTSAGVTITDDGDVACVTCADGGAVAIGPAAPGSGTRHLIRGNNNGSSYSTQIENTFTSSGGAVVFLKTGSKTNIAGMLYYYDGDDNLCGYIDANPSANTVAYTNSSDARLKTNHRDFDGIELVKQMKPSKYERICNAGVDEIGLVAQELISVIPEAVSVGNEDLTVKPWGIDYGRITPVLVKAIQELEARLAALEAK
jgi:hypothetical protein